MAISSGPARGCNRKAAGFTLLELLVVLVIASLVLTMTAVFLAGGTKTATLKSAAREIASAVRITQSEAIKRNREVVFVLDVEARQYTVGDNFRRGELPRNLTLELFTTQGERLDETKAGIRFFPDGSSTGGKITVANATHSYDVLINWLTGRVAIRE